MPAPDYAAEIAQLESALASGELTIESDGERVTYQSFAQIRQRVDYFRAQAASGTGLAGRPGGSGSSFAVFSGD